MEKVPRGAYFERLAAPLPWALFVQKEKEKTVSPIDMAHGLCYNCSAIAAKLCGGRLVWHFMQ